MPLIVPPAKTTVEVPGSIVPAVYVQLLVVRSVPARVSVPEGLLMTSERQVAGGGRGRAGERLRAGAVDRAGWPSRRSYVEAWLMSPWAARVPVPLSAPLVSAERAGGGQRRPGGDRGRRPEVDRVEGCASR